MVITKKSQYWHGTESADLAEFLQDYARTSSAGRATVGSIVHARCAACAGTTFAVTVDDGEGFAARCCATCGVEFLMLDSADTAADADPGDAACPCGGEVFNVAVGFAFREDGDVRWVYVALRCVQDDLLGVYVDWKIDYGPTGHLLDQV